MDPPKKLSVKRWNWMRLSARLTFTWMAELAIRLELAHGGEGIQLRA